MAFPLRPPNRGQAAGDVGQLRPPRACLPAAQADVSLPHPDRRFALGPEAGEPPAPRRRHWHTVRGVVRGAVADDRAGEASCQPPGGGPVGMAPIRTHRGTVDAAVRLRAADPAPAIVAHALPQARRWGPRVEQPIAGAPAPALASIAQHLPGQGVRGGAALVPGADA
jgi:hypothetical protein